MASGDTVSSAVNIQKVQDDVLKLWSLSGLYPKSAQTRRTILNPCMKVLCVHRTIRIWTPVPLLTATVHPPSSFDHTLLVSLRSPHFPQTRFPYYTWNTRSATPGNIAATPFNNVKWFAFTKSSSLTFSSGQHTQAQGQTNSHFVMHLHLPRNLLCPQPPCLPTNALRNKSTETAWTHWPLLKGLTIFLPPSPIRVDYLTVQTKSKTRPFFYPSASASTSLSTPSSPSGRTTLTYRLISTKHLALLAVIPTSYNSIQRT